MFKTKIHSWVCLFYMGGITLIRSNFFWESRFGISSANIQVSLTHLYYLCPACKMGNVVFITEPSTFFLKGNSGTNHRWTPGGVAIRPAAYQLSVSSMPLTRWKQFWHLWPLVSYIVQWATVRHVDHFWEHRSFKNLMKATAPEKQ
jgi:hypothetical protein